MTPKTPIYKIHGPTYTVGWWLNEPRFHLRANMVSFEKAFDLFDFVVEFHNSKLINISYFTTLFNLHGDSLIVL